MHQQKLKTAIKWVLVKERKTLDEFKEALARNGIIVLLRQSVEGNIYGITYVDFKSKCVFNGSDLGKEFSAKGILEQSRPEEKQDVFNVSQIPPIGVRYRNDLAQQKDHKQDQEQGNQNQSRVDRLNAIEALLKPEEISNYIPNQLLKKKKQKKKSKGLRL